MSMVMPSALIWMLWEAWVQLSISSAQIDVPQVLTHKSKGALSAGGDPVGSPRVAIAGSTALLPFTCVPGQNTSLSFYPSPKTSLAVPNSPVLCLSQQPVHIHLEYFVNKSSKMNHTKQQHPSTAEAAHILNVLPAHESWSPPMGGTSDRLVSWVWEVDLLQHLVSGSQESFHPSPCVCMTTCLSNGNATSSAAQYSTKGNLLIFLASRRFLQQGGTNPIISLCSHTDARGEHVPFQLQPFQGLSFSTVRGSQERQTSCGLSLLSTCHYSLLSCASCLRCLQP